MGGKDDSPTSANEAGTAAKVVDASREVETATDTGHPAKQKAPSEIQSFLDASFSLRDEVFTFFSIWMFVTICSTPAWATLHPARLMKGMCYFPVVGAMVGSVAALFYDLAAVPAGLPSSVAAACSTAATLYMTGCLHEDGLADSADGIGGGWSRKQILRIMTDSRIGTYGCAAFVLYIIVKIELLAGMERSHWELYRWQCHKETISNLPQQQGICGSHGAGPALVVGHALARLTSPFLIRRHDYVDDEDGPKTGFYSIMVQAKVLVSRQRVLMAMSFVFVLSAAFYGPWTASGLIVAVLILSHAAGTYAERVLGGVMGDYLGATICISDLFVLTLIFVRKSASGILSDIYQKAISSEGKYHSLQQTWTVLQQDERVCVILRFIVFAFISITWRFAVWCSKVDNDSAKLVSGNRAKGGDAAESQSQAAKDSPRALAQQVLSSNTSTFTERYEAVQQYIDALAKPVGSLGTLESWAARLAALQRTLHPDTRQVSCLIFVSDHGAAAAPEDGGEGCSAYPQAVTRSVCVGLERGVAGASVLAKTAGVKLRVVDVGVIGGPFSGDKVVVSADDKLVHGTRNFCTEPAMSVEQSERILRSGRDNLIRLIEETSCKVVVLGEVGIGNTTSSSALIAALTGKPVEALCGGGAFASRELDEKVVSKKISIVKKALAKHCNAGLRPAEALARLGGAEIAAMVGAMLEASERDVAVLVDGFIATVAALIAVSLSPNVCHVLFFTSQSAEKGQKAAIEKIQDLARDSGIPTDSMPALSMGLRMGEGTAALLAVPLLCSAAAVLSDMATIQDIVS